MINGNAHAQKKTGSPIAKKKYFSINDEADE